MAKSTKAVERAEAGGSFHEQVLAFKKDKILEEALTLFHQNGFERTTVDQIAERIGVTKPYIYSYFTSKMDILFQLCDRISTAVIDAIVAGENFDGDAEERLRHALYEYALTIIRHHRHIAVFYRDESSLPADKLADIGRKKKIANDKILKILRDGDASGQFSFPDTNLAMHTILGSINWSYTWYAPSGRMSPTALAKHMVEMALRQVRPLER